MLMIVTIMYIRRYKQIFACIKHFRRLSISLLMNSAVDADILRASPRTRLSASGCDFVFSRSFVSYILQSSVVFCIAQSAVACGIFIPEYRRCAAGRMRLKWLVSFKARSCDELCFDKMFLETLRPGKYREKFKMCENWSI